MELSEIALSQKSNYDLFDQYSSLDMTNYSDFNESIKSIFSNHITNNKIPFENKSDISSLNLNSNSNETNSKEMKSKKKHKSSLIFFICGKCMKIYKSKENTLLHYKNVHLKEKPYICSYCNVGFSHRNGKLYHERKFHTKYFPYECPLSKIDYTYIIHIYIDCNMAFPTKSSLKYHLQSKKHKECSIINV